MPDNRFLASRPTIGLLLGELEERYQSRLWPVIVEVAREKGVNLFCFPGGPLRGGNEFMAQRNVVFDLVSPKNLDALLLFSGNLANYVTQEEINAFCQRYQPLPMVSIGLPIDNIPSILVDNSKGIRTVTRHLIENHHAQRIAFIRGPVEHIEAELRFQAFIETLSEFDLPLIPEIVVTGNFSSHSGQAATLQLIKQQSIDFDAIVSANDRMAIGAMEALKAHGFRIPDEVMIAGFDDIDESSFTTPPLTTAAQPFEELSRRAIEMLLEQIDNKTVPERVLLSTELIVRKSCGCLMVSPINVVNNLKKSKLSVTEILTQNWDAILSEMLQTQKMNHKFPNTVRPAWMEQLLSGFIDEMKKGQTNVFISVLNDILQQAISYNHSIPNWQNTISVIRRHVLPATTTYDDLSYAETIWEQARELICEMAERAQASIKLQTIERSLLVNEIGQLLLSTFEIDELIEQIRNQLPRLGIPSCYIALYENQNDPTGWAQLIMAYSDRDDQSDNRYAQRFLSTDLFPESLDDSKMACTFAINPLYFRDQNIGFIIFEMGPLDGMIYETLRRQISSALKGTLVIRERTQAEVELRKYQDFLEELVKERTEKLVITNEQLQREIDERRRVEDEIRQLNEDLEKRVAARTSQLQATNQELESFSYSVSHDLRAPLRSINGYTHILLEDYQGQFPEEVQNILGRVLINTCRMDELIQNLLSFSRLGRQALVKTTTNCNLLVQQALSELDDEFQKKPVEITINELPECQADPVLLRQVFINLLANAIKFSNKREIPQIEIGYIQSNGKSAYYVKDNGIGFDMQYSNRLFGVFQRLHSTEEYEGSGIGLAIVKRIIVRHGGEVWAEAKENQGATFYFTVD